VDENESASTPLRNRRRRDDGLPKRRAGRKYPAVVLDNRVQCEALCLCSQEVQFEVRPRFATVFDIRADAVRPQKTNGFAETTAGENDVIGVEFGTRNYSRLTGRHLIGTAGRNEGARVVGPVLFVEIGGEEPATIVGQKRVDTHRVIGALVLRAPQVPLEGVVGNRKKRLIRAGGALDLWLAANARLPLVFARRRITRAAVLCVFPPQCEHIRAAGEQSPEKRELLVAGRLRPELRGFVEAGKLRFDLSTAHLDPTEFFLKSC
jgi:hypothetical protein